MRERERERWERERERERERRERERERERDREREREREKAEVPLPSLVLSPLKSVCRWQMCIQHPGELLSSLHLYDTHPRWRFFLSLVVPRSLYSLTASLISSLFQLTFRQLCASQQDNTGSTRSDMIWYSTLSIEDFSLGRSSWRLWG